MSMKKIVHMTESQVNEIMDKLNEDGDTNVVNYSPDTFGGETTVDNALDVALKTKQNFPQKDVYALGTELKTGVTDKNQLKHDIRQNAQKVLSNIVEKSETYTKKQLKEAKLRYLKENSVSFSKKDFKKKIGGK